MNDILQWGLNVVIFVQKIRSGFFDNFFSFLSFLGSDMFYLLFLPFFFWCLDKKTAVRLFILFLISSWVNSEAKNLFNLPRPYDLNPDVKIDHTTGPGLPSGHAQGSIVVWGFLALHFRKRLFTVFSVILVLLIALSRIYLGVHFPTDIFGGWLIGLALLIAFNVFYDRLANMFAGIGLMYQIILLLLVPLILAFISPNSWSIMSLSMLSGFGIAHLIESRYINMEEAGGYSHMVMRYVLGIVIIIIIYYVKI